MDVILPVSVLAAAYCSIILEAVKEYRRRSES